ncbi:MAG: hypothetical protein HY343_09430 [Lentisphaerae bacterium]|nr:hypothetical protein [Lentisphaerota bacterium]
MNAGRTRGLFWPLTALILAWGLATLLAIRLSELAPIERESEDPVIARLFSETRTVFSGVFFEKADEYFHKGKTYFHKTALNDVFQRLKADITPERLVHLEQKNIGEILPWLYFATRYDSSNVEAYVTTAFLLTVKVNRPDLAEQVMAEAQKNNPRDYRVFLEKSRLYLKIGRLDRARLALDRGLALWRSPAGAEENARIDKAEMFHYRGLLYETDGDMEQAKADYRRVLELFPGREGMARRLHALETAGRAEPAPKDLWNNMLLDRALDRHDEDDSGSPGN